MTTWGDALDDWAIRARRVHDRILRACRDDVLVLSVADLHAPVRDEQGLVCLGCDQDSELPPAAPVWPCRTYALIAANRGITELERQITGDA